MTTRYEVRVPERLSRLQKLLPAAVGEGAPVAVGLAVLGLSAYVFLAAAGRALGPVGFAPVSVAWTVVFALAGGLLAPFEQETGRVVVGRRAQGTGTGPVAVTAAVTAAVFVGAVVTVSLAALGPLSDLLFRGDEQLLLSCLVALIVLAAAYVSRGLLAGAGRFGLYGTQLGLEGAVRGLGALLLLALGVGVAPAYSWLLALAALMAVSVTAPRRSDLLPGPALPWRSFAPRVATLLVTAGLSSAMVNSGPVLVELLSDSQGAEAGVFLAVLVLARVPLFLFAAVQAVVLPRLARARALGGDAFRSSLRRTLTAVVALASAGVLVFGVAGPELVRLFFGPDYAAQRHVAILLALGSGVYMVAVLLTQALVALDRHRATVGGWLVGAAVLIAVTASIPGLEERVAVGLLAGSAAAAAAMWWAVRREGRP